MPAELKTGLFDPEFLRKLEQLAIASKRVKGLSSTPCRISAEMPAASTPAARNRHNSLTIRGSPSLMYSLSRAQAPENPSRNSSVNEVTSRALTAITTRIGIVENNCDMAMTVTIRIAGILRAARWVG